AVFDSSVASWLLHFARHTGFRTVLIDPKPLADGAAIREHADAVHTGFDAAGLDDTADVVATDHHRPELGEMLRDALRSPARWVGVMGSPRHTPPHIAMLRDLGVPESEISRVHRPIGLNIGSKTPP